MHLTLFDAPYQLTLLAAISVLSGFVQGVTGFGFGMISMALLPHLMSVKAATTLVALVAFMNVISILWQMRRNFDLRKPLGLLVGVLVGVPLGVFLLARLNNDMLQCILGGVIILAAVQGMMVNPETSKPISPRWGPVAGFFGGAVGAAFNVGGAPIIMYVYRQKWSKETIVTVLQTVFFIGLLYRLIIYTCTGLMSAELAVSGLVLTPFAVLGSAAGVRMQRRLDVNRLRVAVNVLLVVLGVSLLL